MLVIKCNFITRKIMRFNIFFIFLTICLSEVIEIPEEIQSFCPYTDFCNKTAVETFEERNFQYGSVPCCAPCRCDDKCGLRMDCCFAEMDKYKLVENGKAACVRPVDGDISENLVNRYYYMIQSCGIEDLNNSLSGRVDRDCLHDKNGQVNIAPVSSLDSKLIFVNAKCAECNDVINYHAWNFYSNFIIGNLDNADNSSFTVKKIFISPTNDDGMIKRRCLNEFFTDECSENDPRLSLCKSLYAPFLYIPYYFKNVFCAACSFTIDIHVCVPPASIDFRYLRMNFGYLIDTSVAEKAKKVNMLSQSPQSVYEGDACMESITDHQILCPDGMLHTPDGCQYYITGMTSSVLTLQLKLQPVGGAVLSEEMLNRLTSVERSDPLAWTHIPCSDIGFTEIVVYTEINKDVSKPVNSFVIQLKNESEWLDLPNVIPALRKCIDGQWSITVAKSTYVMNASLDKYQSYIQDGLQRRKKIIHLNTKIGNQEEDARPKMFNLVAKKGYISPRPLSVSIGKIFFCKNIELQTTEVEFGYGEITLLSSNVTIRDNITLGDNEFMIRTKVHADGKSYNVVVVCVEDFFCNHRHRLYAKSLGHNNMFGVMVLGIVLEITFIATNMKIFALV